MGTDHTEFNNPAWTQGLGLSDGALLHIEGSELLKEQQASRPAGQDNEPLNNTAGTAATAEEEDKTEKLEKKREEKDHGQIASRDATMGIKACCACGRYHGKSSQCLQRHQRASSSHDQGICFEQTPR